MTELARTTIDRYGSYIEHGPIYSVLECRGPVRYRQELASARGVICYFEAHLNASSNPDIRQHGFCIAGDPIPPGTDKWCNAFMTRVAGTFDLRNAGLLKGGPGSGNVKWLKWPTPSMLLEPMFVSDPVMAEMLASGGGCLDDLAKCLVDSVVECFPKGGLIGASKGHIHRGTGDMGAPVALFDSDGDGDTDLDPKFDTEGELVEFYVDSFVQQIVAVGAMPVDPRDLEL